MDTKRYIVITWTYDDNNSGDNIRVHRIYSFERRVEAGKFFGSIRSCYGYQMPRIMIREYTDEKIQYMRENSETWFNEYYLYL